MFSNPEKIIQQFNVDPGMVVADFGSGSGYYSIALAKLVGKSGKVYSVDIQQPLLQRLKNQAQSLGLSNISVVWGDLDELRGSTLKDGIIDRVVVANLLFQVEKKENLIDEIARVLKPKGKILLVEWTDSYGGLGPQPEFVIKKDVAQTMFDSHGFEFEKEIQAGEHHYGLIFRKR